MKYFNLKYGNELKTKSKNKIIKDSTNVFKRLVSVFLVLLILSINTISFAINLTEQKKQRDQISADKKLQEQKVKSIQSELSANVQEIANCEQNIKSKEVEIQTLANEQGEIEKEITSQKKELEKSQKEVKKIEKLTKERLVQIYENGGNNSIISILALSDGLSDFLSNFQLMREVTRIDASLLSSLGHKKEKNQSLKKELETKNKILEENKTKQINLKKELEASKAQKEEINKKLSQEELKQKDKLEEINRQLRIKNAAIEAEIARIEAAKRGGNSQAPLKYVGGTFAWPVPSTTYITAGYGVGYAQGYPGPFHTGVDIGARMGSIAVAANDGVVITASYNGGYGNMVMIDHGGGVYTIYGHGSSIPVRVGQSVKRGQTILITGSTGYSTGPHLHFEVRNGRYRHVNPMPYFR